MKNTNQRELQEVARLEHLRAHADAMRGGDPADWQWVGRWDSQRMFGITEKRAKEMAARHGGEARRMDD